MQSRKKCNQESELRNVIEECSATLLSSPACLKSRALRGHACMKTEQWDMAVMDFTEILRVRKDDTHGMYSRGTAYFKTGRVQEAVQDYTTVLELNPEHAMARYARAGCYNTLGDFAKAIEDYTLALESDCNGKNRGSDRLYMHESAEKAIMEKSNMRQRSLSKSNLLDISNEIASEVTHTTTPRAGMCRSMSMVDIKHTVPKLDRIITTKKNRRKTPRKVRFDLAAVLQVESSAEELPYANNSLAELNARPEKCVGSLKKESNIQNLSLKPNATGISKDKSIDMSKSSQIIHKRTKKRPKKVTIVL